MQKTLCIVGLLLATTIGAPTVLRATETFNVELTGIGASDGSVVGTIMTDGTPGTLATGDILSWNLTITDGNGNTFDLNTGNSTPQTFFDLSENNTHLLFNFSGTGRGVPYIPRSDRRCHGPRIRMLYL